MHILSATIKSEKEKSKKNIINVRFLLLMNHIVIEDTNFTTGCSLGAFLSN